jgi:hypothetical protein
VKYRYRVTRKNGSEQEFVATDSCITRCLKFLEFRCDGAAVGRIPVGEVAAAVLVGADELTVVEPKP